MINMGFWDLFKKNCNEDEHDWELVHVDTNTSQEGTMFVSMCCKKCGENTQTFHDLTETEEICYRHPSVEKLLHEAGYFEYKNDKRNRN